MKNKQVILEIIDKLEGLNYFIFAGFAVYLYTNGKRSFQDIDIVLDYESLNEFANRLESKVGIRKIVKGSFNTEDYFFNVNYKGQEVEAISVLPERENEVNAFKKEFTNREKVNFFGKDIFLAPKEGIVAHKAMLNREKDKDDLLLLKNDINKQLLKEIVVFYEEQRIFKILRELGYDL